MKNYIDLKIASYREYKAGDFAKVFEIFLVFQEKAKIGTYHNLTKGQSEQFVSMFLFEEFKKLVNRSKYKYVGINEETGEIFGFACFTQGIITEKSVDLQLVFKHPNYIFNRKMKYLLMLIFKKIKKNNRIYTILGDRKKFDKYVEFVKRVFKIKVHQIDTFGRVYIEFL